ncbi:hypothetical protein RHMOL_Rhmol13G0307500 [Rhododendron molle]|uniref:Uncharacterized protein n=1 Tax=Rhododendron molle TaxID=49168 RepID=A0ACC0LCZ4_RHOML|nr:hypothetical protein RHMOL_Rhmol13G0307500 [Rhododendron molle]
MGEEGSEASGIVGGEPSLSSGSVNRPPPEQEEPTPLRHHHQLQPQEEEEGISATSWKSYISEDLPRTVFQSTDSAIRSARSLQHNSQTHLRTLRDFIPEIGSHYRTYEDAFFSRVKDGLMDAKEHPFVAGGVAVTASLLLMRGSRRFLFRHTFGRLQSEEAQFVRAEKHVKELNLSVDLMKNESRKLLERAALAEKDMRHGQSELMNAGTQIQRLARSVYKVEVQSSDLMDGLRELPGREALRLRAEASTMSFSHLQCPSYFLPFLVLLHALTLSLCGQVASLASHLRQERVAMNRRVLKISELGIPV